MQSITAATESKDLMWTIEGLPAHGPAPEYKEKLELFGQFVGDWDILECKYLQDDGTWSNDRGRYTGDGFLMEKQCKMFGQ